MEADDAAESVFAAAPGTLEMGGVVPADLVAPVGVDPGLAAAPSVDPAGVLFASAPTAAAVAAAPAAAAPIFEPVALDDLLDAESPDVVVGVADLAGVAPGVVEVAGDEVAGEDVVGAVALAAADVGVPPGCVGDAERGVVAADPDDVGDAGADVVDGAAGVAPDGGDDAVADF